MIVVKLEDDKGQVFKRTLFFEQPTTIFVSLFLKTIIQKIIMYKQHLTDNLLREIDLLKNLATHIEADDLEFRPNEKVRSTHELMMYVSGIGATMLRWFIKNDLNPEEWEKIRAYRKTLTIENFAERLEEQRKEIIAYMDGISEDDLINKKVLLPNKEEMVLGAAIINAPIKWLATYRMQLFLYLKMNGKTHLGTKEAWTVALA
ncbi:MAG: hypothetical protein RJA07_1602 [Bacteroidota bacterium]